MRFSSDMIRLEGVWSGPLHGLSFDVAPGTSAKIVVASEERHTALQRLLFGLLPPERGEVYLLNEPVYRLPAQERLRLFRRVAIVPEGGGLISNLKVWENILLPRAYHAAFDDAEIETRILGLFREFGFGDQDTARLMGRLPDTLPAHEKRLIALARAMLTDADVVIYDYLFSGLERKVAMDLVALTGEFQRRKTGRASLHVCADDAFATLIAVDQSIGAG
jgi:phospholipid/cholesterol/gamma-HCH transport system ATP-binding protein